MKFSLLNQIPPELDGLIFDFIWDEHKLHALELPTCTVLMAELEWQLDLPWWQHDGHFFAVSPNQVAVQPQKYIEQFTRTLNADLQYPIIVRQVAKRLVVMDGVHRLLKARLEKLIEVEVAVFSDSLIPNIMDRD